MIRTTLSLLLRIISYFSFFHNLFSEIISKNRFLYEPTPHYSEVVNESNRL